MTSITSKHTAIPARRRDLTRGAEQRHGVNLREAVFSGTMRRNGVLTLVALGWLLQLLAALPVFALVTGDDAWVTTHAALFGCVHVGFLFVILALPQWRFSVWAKWTGVAIPACAVAAAWTAWVFVLEPLPRWLGGGPPVKPASATIAGTVLALIAVGAALLVPVPTLACEMNGVSQD